MTTADVDEFIAHNFDESEREAAVRLVSSATLHDGSAVGPRLVRCALIASGGSLERLRIEIEHLKIDYRDVILAGEYILRDGQYVRIRDLNEPMKHEA